MPDHYKLIPKKPKQDPLTFPDPIINDEQYDHPIGPERPAHGPIAFGKGVVSKIQTIAKNPNVQKAGRFIKERTSIFQENIGRLPNEKKKQINMDKDPFGINGVFKK